MQETLAPAPNKAARAQQQDLELLSPAAPGWVRRQAPRLSLPCEPGDYIQKVKPLKSSLCSYNTVFPAEPVDELKSCLCDP